MAVRQLEHAEVGVRRGVARIKIQRGTKCAAGRVDIALARLDGTGQVLRRRKLWVSGNRKLNRPRRSGEIMVKELRGGRVVVSASAAREEVPECSGDGIEFCGIAGIRVK